MSGIQSLSLSLSLPDVNIGIGVSIFSETQSNFGDLTIFWVYLAFAIFGVILNTGLLLFFTSEAVLKGKEGTYVCVHHKIVCNFFFLYWAIHTHTHND